ncbi:MAG: endoribonuclease MazF [Chloroflexi bacterium]|nr:endoribonuclease MazF [Chloroflexota bacterium]
MVVTYIPDRGDIIWINFDPQVGHEQAGHRPALVVSRRIYNRASELLTCFPIRSRQKGYGFEVPLPRNFEVKGVVLADQVKSMDWRLRKARFFAKAPDAVLAETLDKLSTLVQ